MRCSLIITLLRIHIWWDTYPFPITHVAFSHSSPIAVENRAFVYTTTHRGKLKELCKRWHNMNVAISAPFIALPPLLQLFQSKKYRKAVRWCASLIRSLYWLIRLIWIGFLDLWVDWTDLVWLIGWLNERIQYIISVDVCLISCISHTSYLSHSSHVRHVEKNLSCGEISDFYT